MKVIDILNKIANGEDVPEKFRFAGQIFEKQGSYIEDEDGDSIFESISNDFSNINGKVEIIEEDKKIEKLRLVSHCSGTFEEEQAFRNRRDDEIATKINKIIDYINKEK